LVFDEIVFGKVLFGKTANLKVIENVRIDSQIPNLAIKVIMLSIADIEWRAGAQIPNFVVERIMVASGYMLSVNV